MLALRADKWVRVSSGLALLVLLAAQEKAYPWLAHTVTEEAPATTASVPDDGEDATDKPAPKRLPHLLPDPPTPRWPAGWQHGVLRQFGGTRDSIVCCGECRPTTGASAWLPETSDACAWRALEPLRESLDTNGPTTIAPPARDPAVTSAITRTGPPLPRSAA
ncbi:MAG: hypothetical protein KA383_00425 [Phycisphaerae bacterium]|nr:hypothetical protein [Phycisphaerae bacterium]